MLGYFSARNYALDLLGADGVAGKNVEPDQIYGMALSYCQANPDLDWDDTAREIYNQLR